MILAGTLMPLYSHTAEVTTDASPVEPSPDLGLEEQTPMADGNPSTFFSAYPGIMNSTGSGDDDSVQHALLTSHANASVERNQDSQFAAARSQAVHRDVVGVGKDARAESLQTKYDLAVQVKDSEIRAAERLAAIEAKLDQMQIGQLSRDLAESRADSRTGATNALLAQILSKLPSA